MTEDTFDLTRRSMLRTAGALGAAGALGVGATGTVAADTSTIDDQLDLSADGPHEVIVVFDDRDSMALLDGFDLPEGRHEYGTLPMTYTALSGDQIRSLGDEESVRRVKKAVELDWFNDDSREATGVDAVQHELGYDGSSVDVAVIDSGFSGPHPDFDGRLESNWQWVDNPLGERDADWVNLGPDADTDDLGHGTHCAGIVGGDGSASDGQFEGMAPGATISVYSTNEAVYLPYAVGAWDHLLGRAADPDDDFDPDVVSNSYGVARDVQYNPNDPVNVATWEAFTEGIVPVFAAGNSGPDADTLSRFAKAPHVLCVGATRDDKHVTNFSSRGRTPDEDRETNYDRKGALHNLWRYHFSMTGRQWVVDVEEYDGTLGPTGTGSDFYEWQAPPNADSLELDLSITPDGEQISMIVHEGSKDGDVIAKLGEEPVYQHYTLETDVEGDTTYWIELEPATNVYVDYHVDLESHQKLGEPEEYRPVGVYRPAVGTPGNSVMSTVGPTDPLDALEPDDRTYYTPMTGTSMACPAAAGICALIVDAARQNDHDADPIDVITTMEATAEDVHEAYTPWNVGAGFVDAEAAVSRAETGDFARFDEVSLVDPDLPTSLSVSGSRSDDGDAFTGGQANQVDITVSSLSHAAEVRDTIPAEWNVADAGDVERVERVETADDDVKRVYLGSVSPDETAVTRTYFAEAPDDATETGDYVFGPAEANSAKTDDGWVAFGGTDTNAVVSEDTET